ncbi:hypothetical protein ACFO5X_06540 [Seohaeicola nanhaiensis]|uniref:Uncharacterized protein n=1 Tax=Seohaeicola nanhaiensis TaxID=1387282 RepID=A0ABV9KDG1_9RHOB
MTGDRLQSDDPKNLVREAYRIEGITEPECRSIFLDWALSLPQGADVAGALNRLLDHYAGEAGHPMTSVLRAGLESAGPPRRRGGWRSRPRGTS